MRDDRQQVYLVGIGPGSPEILTVEVLDCIRNCDCIIGAKRMTDSVAHLNKPVKNAYLLDEVKAYIEAHQEYRKIVIVCSGDTGFYSSAKELCKGLRERCTVSLLPGISSIVYLASRLGVSWEQARLISIHGRNQNYIHIIARNKKTFLLFGGVECAETFCHKIIEYGLNHIKIWIGKSLSYKGEQIICKSGAELRPKDLHGLTVLFVENHDPLPAAFQSISDEEFIRGNVPMTKAEVRTISILKMGLTNQSILYDVGAGTGSVAVEAATLLEGLKVYAVEKNPEGIELLKQNQKKFYVDQIIGVLGTAPDVLADLEPPTHMFIGGSSGNLKEILTCVKKKNPSVKVTINAISLETLTEVLQAEQDGLLHDIEIVQVTVAKAKKLSKYHMMSGQNPIYIITERV